MRIASAILFFIFLAVPAGAQQLTKVPISYSSSGITSIEFFIAKEKGYFKEEGLEPQLIQMSANAAIAAGITGELAGLSSMGSAIRAVQRGAPLTAVPVSLDRKSVGQGKSADLGGRRL